MQEGNKSGFTAGWQRKEKVKSELLLPLGFYTEHFEKHPAEHLVCSVLFQQLWKSLSSLLCRASVPVCLPACPCMWSCLCCQRGWSRLWRNSLQSSLCFWAKPILSLHTDREEEEDLNLYHDSWNNDSVCSCQVKEIRAHSKAVKKYSPLSHSGKWKHHRHTHVVQEITQHPAAEEGSAVIMHRHGKCLVLNVVPRSNIKWSDVGEHEYQVVTRER